MRFMTSFLTLACGLGLAQQGRIAGPLSGYVFDRAARALRPVSGVPGASVIGSPIDLGFAAAGLWVSPQLDSAVAVAADGSLHFLRLDAGAAAERSFNGAAAAPQSVSFSPSGSAAALFSREVAVIVTGLPDAPVVSATIDLGRDFAHPSRLPALHRVATAVSDDGAYLLRASGGTVTLYGASGEHRALAAGVDAAFAPAGHAAAVADLSGAGIVVFDDAAAGTGRRVLGAPDPGMTSSAGLAFSQDGRKLFLASPASRNVASFDMATGSREAIPCRVTPETLVRMGTVYRLNELGTDPLWLLDASPAQPQVVFVPAISAN
jgi:hypothetical protein